MPNRDMVNQFIDEAVGEELIETAKNQDLSEGETREIQSGLNLLSVAFPEDNADALLVDGYFGPKTYARLKQFIAGLPQDTQDRVRDLIEPMVNVD